MQRKWLVAIVVVVLGGSTVALVARASDAAPPSKMTLETAIRLDRDLAHIREADAQCRQVHDAARSYDVDAMEILTANKIDMVLFNKGEIKIDFTTGEIKRPTTKGAAP